MVFVGGDQLTAARARGSQCVRSNSERGKDQLQGLQAVVEDWHCKVCFLGVCISELLYHEISCLFYKGTIMSHIIGNTLLLAFSPY